MPTPRTAAPRTLTAPRTVCLVGAGPRSLGVLDRLGAHATREGRPVVVHVVDPYAPGSGRIWRTEQHPLLWMNSRAVDVTVLPDDSCTLPAPVRTGPTLFEWLDAHRGELQEKLTAEGRPELAAEVAGVTEGTFVSRALGSRYLRWAWDRAVAGLPPGSTVHRHAARVTDVVDEGDADGTQRVRLDDGSSFTADTVLLAQGHPDVDPGARETALAGFARDNGLRYVRPAYTNDLGIEDDLVLARPGEDVLVLGMGLAFVDLVVLLAQGRGGTFTTEPDGTLRYHPCGAEPVLHVGSRRGVPYRSKITYELHERPPAPRFLTVDLAMELLSRKGSPLDLRTDLWPLVERELAGAHYHELFARHPERTRLPADEFAERFARTPWGSADLAELVASAVPDPQDRLDLAAFDRPLADLHPGSAQEVHDAVRAHVAADVARRGDPQHSPDAAVFFALLGCYSTIAEVSRRGLLEAGSVLEVDGWWHGFFSYVASGPPPQRLRQLLALADAGVVRFLGADVEVSGQDGHWVARSGSSPHEVTSDLLVDARLPNPSISGSSDPLLRNLSRRGEVVDRAGRMLADPDQRTVHVDGSTHPRRFAVGPWVAGTGWASAFARPGLDAGFFRLNDRVAQSLLDAARPRATVDVRVPASRTAPQPAPQVG